MSLDTTKLDTFCCDKTQMDRSGLRRKNPPCGVTRTSMSNDVIWTLFLRNVTALRGTSLNQIISVILLLLTASSLLHSVRADPDLLKMQFVVDNDRSEREVECKVNCTNVRHKPVCGTDGRTYQNKCELKRMRKCEDRNVQVASRGRCSGALTRSSRGTKCIEQRRQALAQPQQQRTYIPECTAEGTFSDVQCHLGTGYCWCVTPEGTPIPGSSVSGRAQEVRCRTTKGCSPTERAQFNTNLIALFSVEFERIPKPTQPKSPAYPGAGQGLPIQSGSDSLLDTPEKRVIEWKFSELDVNKDSLLRKKEIRSLKRLVKKLVEPKPCAKTFDTYCDLDGDGKVARSEWSVCLGVDINNEHATATVAPPVTSGGVVGRNSRDRPPRRGGTKQRQRANRGRGRGGAGGVTRPRAPPAGSRDNAGGRHLPPLLRSSSTSATTADVIEEQRPSLFDRQGPQSRPNGLDFSSRLRPVDETTQQQNTQSEAPTKLDCTEERRNAEEMDRMDPEGRIFIPECLTDGKYRSEQCHKSTGYCWCVNQDNGKPIPGTSTHNVTPDCSTATYRLFKGCPYPQRKRFLEELIDTLTTQMVDFANNNTNSNLMPEPNPDHSFEERVARWKLRMLDRNNNNALERGEVKDFKDELKRQVRSKKSLRKCGRNFVRFCDENTDKRITTDEWINCMGLSEQSRNLPENPKRKGENPFRKYLKG